MDIANNRLAENRSRLLPVLEANIQLTDFLMSPTNVTTGALLEGDIPNNPTWQQIRSMQYGVNAGIQLSMPIYNKAIFRGIDVAKTLVNISRLSTEQAKEELTAAIANVYYLAQASHEQASLLQDNIKRMQELCEITQAMYEGGVVMEADLSRVRINLSNIDVRENNMPPFMNSNSICYVFYLTLLRNRKSASVKWQYRFLPVPQPVFLTILLNFV